MKSRGRGNNSNNDWDTVRETSYDSHYPDGDSSESMQFDNKRLYITNVPHALNEEGLRVAFSRFGTLEEAHLSKDPTKRYALVKYETAGEARVAMMKMNKTEPLRLTINIARKNKSKGASGVSERLTSMNGLTERPRRDDTASVGSNRSKNYRPVDKPTKPVEKMDDDMGVDFDQTSIPMDLETLKQEEFDRSLHIKLENLKLERLKIKEQELAVKEKIMILQLNEKRPISNQNRCFLPDGRISVKNSEKFQDNDGGYTAGAGDSLTIPGLQQSPDRVCIVCGVSSDLYCSSCAAVSYCSERCQRRDWNHRHKDVCHNLKRLLDFDPTKTAEIPVISSAAPLRLSNSKLDQEINGTDRAKPKLSQGDRNQTTARNNNTNNRPNNNNSYNDNNNKSYNDNNNKSNRTFTPRKEMRRPQLNGDKNNDARDDAAATQPKPMTPEVAKPVPAKPEPVRPQTIKPEGVNLQAVNLPAVKPAEPARPAQQRLTPAPVKQVKDIKDLKPASCVVEKLSMGATFMASLEAPAADCASKQPGFVCLTIHTDYEDAYSKLCQDFAVQCADNKDTVVPAANRLVSYLSPADGGWYRARCLSAARAALLDAGAVVALPATARCKPVATEYELVPEFCAVIHGPGLKVGMNLQCTLKSKTANGFKVSVVDPESLADLGEAEIERWRPEVELPAPGTAAAAEATVTRPELLNSSRVILLDAKSLARACVRSAAPEDTIKFDSILHDVLLFAIKASPLKEPPQRGTVVISEFTDGVQYRALVKKTKVKDNRYLVEYIEYGNEEVVPLEKLYPCPGHLDLASVPTLASVVQLSAGQPSALAPPALALLDQLKDSAAELVLTLPSGEKTAPSGSLVQLHSGQNKENITKKLEDMCTPEWKKIEERGGDVLETTSIMFNEFPTVKLPVDRPFVLEVVDFNSIENGYINGFPQGEPLAERIYGELTDKINKYAESDLCKEPYLPKIEELCITQCPPYPQWFRAALIEQDEGAGGVSAQVLYVDYGNVETVPVAALRKMLPEFVAGLPGLANLCHIKGFPATPSGGQLAAALEQLQLNDEGRGFLRVAGCSLNENNIYEIDAPELIAALKDL